MSAPGKHDQAEFACDGRLVEWRGAAPYWCLEPPVDVSASVKRAARGLAYWGQVKVAAVVGDDGGPVGLETFRTALFPKDGGYLLPPRDAVRRAVGLTPEDAGTVVAVCFDRLRP